MLGIGRDIVFLSNGITAALVEKGVVEWLPFPRFDSASVFSSVLDSSKGGYFSIRPDGDFSIRASYVGNSLIAKNEFSCAKGRLELIDFMPLGVTAMMRIYRSDVPFFIDIKPVFKYGLINPGLEEKKGGLVFSNPESEEGIELLIEGRYSDAGDGRIRVEPGEGNMTLLYSKDLRYGLFSNIGFVYPDPKEAMDATLKYWEGQIGIAHKVAAFGDAYRRSLSVILGLMYASSGGAIAAPTTSLPEIIGKGRNWDYRYVWIRDASYAAEALAKSGLLYKSRSILSFIFSLVDPSSKSFDHPLYTVDGTPPKAEETLGWLGGHMGSKPVRIGNAAYLQVQADSEGDFVNALATYYSISKDREYILENWWAIEAIVRWIKKSWKEPSISMWEERGGKRHVLHTKMMCWVVMDRVAMLAKEIDSNTQADECRKISMQIKEDIMKNGISEDGTFSHFYGGSEVDSTLLTMPLYGLVDAEDERFKATLEKVISELGTKEGLLRRYNRDSEGDAAHPFILVNTWLSRVYSMLGERKKAEILLNRIIASSTDLLLMPEHVDRDTKEPRGNMPQLFSHSGVIEAILDLDRAKG